MTIKEHIDFWIDKSNEDIETANKMYKSSIYDWSLFVGHLALEKILKACWIKNNNSSSPPKIHNLVTLANYSEICLHQSKLKII